MELHYDRLGSRLTAVGDSDIEHDRPGSRPIRFGDLDLTYDRAGSRPKEVRLAGGGDDLTPDDLVVLYFVLDWIRSQKEQAAAT